MGNYIYFMVYCYFFMDTKVIIMSKQYYLKFSRDYNKLDDELFTTIRRYDKPHYKEGNVILIKSPHKTFEAIIIMKLKRKLKNIPIDFLLQDTETHSYSKAMNLFRRFYTNPLNPNEEITILILKKV